MKRKAKTKRKIKPTKVDVKYNKESDDFLNYGSLRLDETPVVDIIRNHQEAKRIPHERFLYEDAFDKKEFLEKQNETKSLKKNKIIKYLNFIGYFGIIVGCMYQCFSFLTIFFKYPTTVEMNITNDNIMDFPAVTVCNTNP